MPKVPRPDDMPRAQLAPADETPAQINIGVASRIGESGRAMGRAIEAIGNAFGEVAGRIGQARDASNEMDARLAWLKGDQEIQQDIAARAGEDGSLWQDAPKRYDQLNTDVQTRYPISDPAKSRSFQMWRELKTLDRGTEAARTYQGAQRGQFLKGFDADVAGVEDRLAKGEIDPSTFGEYYGALTGKLSAMNRTVMGEAEVQAKTRELQARLTMSLDRYLATKAPAERAGFWDQVSKGKYEVSAPYETPPGAPAGLGQVSAKYESGGRGVGFISSGKDDPGGQSYGIHQLSGAYSMGAFLRSSEGAPYRAAFGASKPQSPEFNRVYREIAGKDPEGFAAAQRAFYTRTHYQPVRTHAEGLGFATSDRGVQETLFSMSVQHEGAKSIVSAARAAAGKSPREQIAALYEARSRYVSNLDSLPSNTKASVLNRYKSEVRDALALAGTQVAAVETKPDPAIKSDAIVPPPGIQVGPPQAGNDNVADPWSDLGEDAAKVRAVATDQPDTPLSKVLDNEQLKALGDKVEAVKSIDDPASMTVGEFRQMLEQERAPVRTADASGATGRDAPTRVVSDAIPKGRLQPGQEFTVRTPKGEFKVPGEWINAIPDKMKQEYARRAREDLKVYERNLRVTADEMIKSQEAHVAEHGRDAPDYDVRAVQAAYGSDPAKIASHARRLREARTLHETFREAGNLPDDELVARLERLRPKPGTPRANEVKDIFDKAEERVASLMKQREKDPGAAVEDSRPVQMVRERLVGGAPRNKLDQIALIDARLTAQAQIEIGEEARRPLPEQEAKALAAPLRGAEPGVFLERIEAMHAAVKEKYGDKFSGLIVRQVLGAFTRDKEKAKALEGALTELDEGGRVSPTTLARIKAMENISRGAEMLGPPAPPERGIMDRIQEFGRRAGKTFVPDAVNDYFWPPKPITPPKAATDYLRSNPQTAREFEQQFRLPPGSAAKYLAPEAQQP